MKNRCIFIRFRKILPLLHSLLISLYFVKNFGETRKRVRVSRKTKRSPTLLPFNFRPERGCKKNGVHVAGWAESEFKAKK